MKNFSLIFFAVFGIICSGYAECKIQKNDLQGYYFDLFYKNFIFMNTGEASKAINNESSIYREALENGFSWEEITSVRENARERYFLPREEVKIKRQSLSETDSYFETQEKLKATMKEKKKG